MRAQRTDSSTRFETERRQLAGLPRLLAAAPHRPLFLAGAIAVLLTMLWWTLQLAAMRFGWTEWPQPSIPPAWAHAMLIQYGLFPLFMFGFLMTTFPRWMDGPQVPFTRYLPVAGGILFGYVLAHIGLLGTPLLLKAGMLLMLLGYSIGVATLGGVLRHAAARNRHGWSCLAAFFSGTIGLGVFTAWLLLNRDPAWALFGIKLGAFCFLLPMYFTVCHRMLPFFTRNVVPDYAMVRPDWSLPVVWGLLIVHFLLDWRGVLDWLWVADVPLALVFAWHAWAWQPWRASRPGLLAVLHLAFAWLPVAFVLFAVQDIAYAVAGTSILGRAPLHALGIGFFGSMLVAMVTRVSQGHSARPLAMGPVAWTCFAFLQLVVLVRIGAEFAVDTWLWMVIAGIGWLLAFLPWVLRSVWIYLTPRIDGHAG